MILLMNKLFTSICRIILYFSLYKFIKLYKIVPLWIKVCLQIVIIAPIALLILMNPTIGQVDNVKYSGPHGMYFRDELSFNSYILFNHKTF